MDEDGHMTPEERPAAPLERGELLSYIKRWALAGYRVEVGGTDAEFEIRWREAFHADAEVAAGGGER